MKIFIICSKKFYGIIPPIKKKLENAGHEIMLPNSYDNPGKEDELKKLSREQHSKWKQEMIRLSEKKINGCDAVLVLNFVKNNMKNYIGGATFIEIYDAFRLNKKIFLYNPIPESIFEDELVGMNPKIINGELEMIR